MLSCVGLFAVPWTVACQAPLSIGFFRQEYWSGLPFPSPGDLPDPGIKLKSPALAGGFFTTEPLGKPTGTLCFIFINLFPGGSDGRVCLQYEKAGFDPWVGKIPWRRKWQPTQVFLPGKFHGWRSLAMYSPWGCKESDTTEPLTLHLSMMFQAL